MIQKRIIVTAYIVSADHKLLLGRKDPVRPSVYPDCWHSPGGGGVEPGETHEAALQREVYEETGINIADATADKPKVVLLDNTAKAATPKKFSDGRIHTISMRFWVYAVYLNQLSSDVKLAAGGDLIHLQWFDKNSLSNMPLTPPAKKLIGRIGLDWLDDKIVL